MQNLTLHLVSRWKSPTKTDLPGNILMPFQPNEERKINKTVLKYLKAGLNVCTCLVFIYWNVFNISQSKWCFCLKYCLMGLLSLWQRTKLLVSTSSTRGRLIHIIPLTWSPIIIFRSIKLHYKLFSYLFNYYFKYLHWFHFRYLPFVSLFQLKQGYMHMKSC